MRSGAEALGLVSAAKTVFVKGINGVFDGERLRTTRPRFTSHAELNPDTGQPPPASGEGGGEKSANVYVDIHI